MLERKNEYTKMSLVEEKLWWYCSLHQLVYMYIVNFFSETDIKIVDAGCGTGGMLKYLGKNGFTNTEGFDISDDAVELCKNAGLKVFKNDIIQISTHYKPESVDVIISNDTFYFISAGERKVLISDFHKILRPNGLVILNLPALKAFRGIHDISVGINSRFSKKDLSEMIDTAKFKVFRATYWPFFLSPLIFISRFFQRMKLLMIKNVVIKSDIDLPPDWLNNFFYKLSVFENNTFRHKAFGSSLFVVLKKIN